MPRKLQMQLNALKFLAAEDYFSNSNNSELLPSESQNLKHLCGDVSSNRVKIVDRYKQSNAANLILVPDTKFFREKLIEPLKQAQSSYMIGNWIAVIALCGILCEMLTLLMYEVTKAHLSINEKSLKNVDIQKSVLGMEFKKLPQEARLKFLKAIGIIGEKSFDKLNEIRNIRNDYIHFFDHSPTDQTMKKQSLRVLQSSTEIARDFLIIGISEGAVQLDPYVEEYLEEMGHLETDTETESESVCDGE